MNTGTIVTAFDLLTIGSLISTATVLSAGRVWLGMAGCYPWVASVVAVIGILAVTAACPIVTWPQTTSGQVLRFGFYLFFVTCVVAEYVAIKQHLNAPIKARR